jgi:hypothetical protein
MGLRKECSMAENGKTILVICSSGAVLLAALSILAITKIDTDVAEVILVIGVAMAAVVAVAQGTAASNAPGTELRPPLRSDRERDPPNRSPRFQPLSEGLFY